jgi:hypothetical protein
MPAVLDGRRPSGAVRVTSCFQDGLAPMRRTGAPHHAARKRGPMTHSRQRHAVAIGYVTWGTSRRVTVDFPNDMFWLIRQRALKQETNFAEQVRRLCESALDQEGQGALSDDSFFREQP